MYLVLQYQVTLLKHTTYSRNELEKSRFQQPDPESACTSTVMCLDLNPVFSGSAIHNRHLAETHGENEDGLVITDHHM